MTARQAMLEFKKAIKALIGADVSQEEAIEAVEEQYELLEDSEDEDDDEDFYENDADDDEDDDSLEIVPDDIKVEDLDTI